MIPGAESTKNNSVDFSCYSCISWLIIRKPLVNGDTYSGSRRDFRSLVFSNPNGDLLTTKHTKHTKGKLAIKEFGK